MRAATLATLLCVSTTSDAVSPKVARLFHWVDENDDGVLSALEMYRRFSDHPRPDGEGDRNVPFPDDIMEAVVSTLDADGDGSVTLHDFSLSGPATSNTTVEQVHVSLTGVPTELRVMFVTLGKDPVPDNTVEVLQGSNGEWQSYNVTTSTYAIPARWWEPEGWLGWIYTATVEGLQPGQAYEYRILSPAGNRTNLTFTLPSVAASNANGNASSFAPTHLGVWGDMGTMAPLGFKVFDQVLEDHRNEPFNATMLFGDISYAGLDTSVGVLNVSKADELEYVWDLFGEQIEPLASEVPFMVGVGNHDMFYNASAFAHRFTMPWQHSSGSPGNFWYSFDVGGIHVVSSSSEHDYSPDSPQMRWLADDLERAEANRATVPWIVFTIHKPMYSSDMDFDHPLTSPEQTAFEPLLLQHSVDLALVGHEHCYERIHPVVNGSVVQKPTGKTTEGHDIYHAPTAPVHVVIGSAGALQEETWMHPQPDWSAVRFANGGGHFYTDTYGYGSLRAHNASHLSFKFVPISGGGVVSDVFWITK